MANDKFSVDLNKPLAFQVGHLGEDYEKWVHQPIVGKKEGPRIFENGVFEFFTKTPWWVVPLVWLPVVSWLVTYTLKKGVPYDQVAATVVAGMALLSFEEYCVHRFLFHMKTTSYWGNTFHYILHGFHHKHPMDRLRLVLPPTTAGLLLLIVWSLGKVVIPEPYSYALAGGEILGYVIYDCTHYYLHYGKPMFPGFSSLKKYHMNHHFRDGDKGFGVTTAVWDWVFGTMPSNSEKIK